MLLHHKILNMIVVIGLALILLDVTTTTVDKDWEKRNNRYGRYQIIEHGKIGYLNLRGRLVVPYSIDQGPQYFSSLMAPVKISNSWGFMDRYGHMVIPASYAYAGEFAQGLAPVATWPQDANSPRYGFIDQHGKDITGIRFHDARPFADNGLAAVRMGNQWGYINKWGSLIIFPKFDEALDFSNRLAAVKSKGKWGYSNEGGSFAIEPKFNAVGSFHDGLAPVRERELWGYIDAKGRYVIQPSFVYARSFHEGLAIVETREGFKVFKASGQEAFDASAFSEMRDFSEGLAAVKLKAGKGLPVSAGKWGFINKSGRLVVPAKFEWASSFQGDMAWIDYKDQGTHRGYVNRQGRLFEVRSLSAKLFKFNSTPPGQYFCYYWYFILSCWPILIF